MKHFFPDSFGVDHKVSKQRIKVVCLDLTKADHQKMVEDWVLSGKCLWAHFGVPCGTASRARLRRLNKKVHGPPPLRNSKFPDGIPGVSGLHLVKLRAANRLYSFMRKLIKKMHQMGIVWTVENPLTSLLWETSYWLDIAEATDPYYCELHNCMFGGTRLKRTCLASNCSAIMALNVLCDGSHEHAAWSMTNGVFDTSLEAEYTPTLAKALATTILEAIAKEYKLKNVVQFSKKLKLSHFHALASAKQPSKCLSMQVVPDFSHIFVLSNLPQEITFSMHDSAMARCVSIQYNGQSFLIPCHSKLLRKTEKKGGDGRLPKISMERTPSLHTLSDVQLQNRDTRSMEVHDMLGCHKHGKDACDARKVVLETTKVETDCIDWVFGVRWTPEFFIKEAVAVGHPFSTFSGLPNEVRWACECIASMSPVDVINNRCSKLGEWLRLSKSFQLEEEALKASMPDCRRRILESKKLRLMRHIIESEGYDDRALADDLASGFSLVGEVPQSHVLPKKLLPATLSRQDLENNSKRSNDALRYMTRSCGDSELDQKLWDKTLLETERGWMRGPLNWEELGCGATLSRRFPLEQSGKVRPIDDLSQSQINSTVTCYEQATVDGPDVISAFCTFLMRCLAGHGRATKLVGRSLDLASAYRQLAVSDDSVCHAFLSVYDPQRQSAALFQQVALPFGSRTAVNAFIRCARFLQWVAARCFKLPLSCYFDDFVSFSCPELAKNTQSTLCLMLDILGWSFDREGPKSDDFSDVVSALGVQFHITDTCNGVLNICNTEKRIRETLALLDEVMAKGTLQKREALTLRGRLAFCDAFVFGRLGKIALQDITKHAYNNPFHEQLTATTLNSMKLLRSRIAEGKPRRLTCELLETLFLFTDASFEENGQAGLGAVLVNGAGKVLAWFGMCLSQEQMAPFLSTGQQTIIGEFETLAVALSLLVWQDLLESVQLMVYIDNEGSKFSLIKGYSTSKAITAVCALAATTLDAHFVLPWFARVPSISNIADYPSRQLEHPLLVKDTMVPQEEVGRSFEESLTFLKGALTPP